MGQATIVNHRGEGLYEVRLNYDLTQIRYELNQLEEQWATYWTRLNDALRTLGDLRRSKSEAADGLNAVIQQWKEGLINKFNEEPPAIPPPDPNDPDTGEPWEDADRAQDGPLFDAISAERTAASVAGLSRNDDLDQSILRYLRGLGASGRIRHDAQGAGAGDRARLSGYYFDATVGVGQVLAFGTQGPAATVALWMRRSSDRALILDGDYTECGVAYLHAPLNPYGYLWGAVFAAPGPPPSTVTEPEPDPAEQAADEADSVLDKIPLPTVEGFEPDKFAEIAAEFGAAAQRVRAAENVVAVLRAEEWANRKRREEIVAMIARLETPIDAWCCRYIDDIPIGTVVDTAEVPGFYLQTATARFTQMGVRTSGPKSIVSYSERSLNLLPPGLEPVGRLHPVENLSPAQAFHSAAMEPGATRWKPLWRYGVIQELTANHTCTVQLNADTVRQLRGLTEILILDANDQRALIAVPINYPPCHSEVFAIGDEVLVRFADYDRNLPTVIGFRREPIPCPGGRLSWAQLS